MIDLHSHILPGLDDGAPDLATSLEMARIAAADGVTIMACTPHIMAGVYENTGEIIERAVDQLQLELRRHSIGLKLVVGADIHISPALSDDLTSTRAPTLNGSRYFLFEPPHHVVPPKLEELAERLIAAGFVPILTHPERLSWAEGHYEIVERLNAMGCLMQLTAGSVLGNFGRAVKSLAEKMIDEGRVDILASDAHNMSSRPPGLSKAVEVVARRLDDAQARRMVLERPLAIVKNEPLSPCFKPTTQAPANAKAGVLSRLFPRRR